LSSLRLSVLAGGPGDFHSGDKFTCATAHYQDGLSGREIVRQFGINRDSVRKMLVFSEPPGYRGTAPIRRPKLDPLTEQIDQWLLEDKSRHRNTGSNAIPPSACLIG